MWKASEKAQPTVVVNFPTTIGLRIPGVVPSVFEMPNKRPAYLEKYV